MTGELHEISEAIGELRGMVNALAASHSRDEESRRDLHRTVNSFEAAQQEMSVTMTAIKESFEKLADSVAGLSITVASHEAFRQRAGGMTGSFKWLFASLIGSGGMLSLYDFLRSGKWH